jgi:lipid-A-disaccharide synthase
MPNIVAGRTVVPELLQGDVTGPKIAAAAQAILDDREGRARITAGLREVRQQLGRGGAADRAAVIAVAMMQGRPA